MDFELLLSNETVIDSETDSQISQIFLNGGEIGLETVITAYSHAILRYCHNILCDYHEAQDAVQLTFIKAYQNKHTFGKNNKNQDKDLSNFLYKIAYNTCIDIIRKRKHTFNLFNNI